MQVSSTDSMDATPSESEEERAVWCSIVNDSHPAFKPPRPTTRPPKRKPRRPRRPRSRTPPCHVDQLQVPIGSG